MKRLLAVTAGFIIAIAASYGQSPEEKAKMSRSYPDARFSTGVDANSPKDSPFRKWTTAALQKHRLDLYKTVPQGFTRSGVPYYITHGEKLPQQHEILAIESELYRRMQAGDKAAQPLEPFPRARRHIGAGGLGGSISGAK